MLYRSPVVAILGHVDHGKTTLLDYIRKSRIAAKEHGGITQRIGAYEVDTKIKGYNTSKITFIDTPGHEAFSRLRAQGAQVADIAILLVDAKDGLMPQTIESISHIKQAKIPFLVAANKIDLPDINLERVKNQLLKHDIQVEDKGGKVPLIGISAKTGKGIQELLEHILFIASESNLTYDPQKDILAYIIETKKDRRGIVPSIIIKNGQMKIGDNVYVGTEKVKIRALINDIGSNIKEINPSAPCEILGFQKLPEVGSKITSQPENTSAAEESTSPRNLDQQETAFSLDDILGTTKKDEKKLSLIIKTDTQGSLQAIQASLLKNENTEIILIGIGDIHKSDVFLAKTSKAIIIGFNTKPDPETADLAKQEKVIIKTYSIIYELLDELNEVADLMQEKEEAEKNLKGEAKVLASFTIEDEKVYGVKMLKGKINAGDELQILRGNNLIGKLKLLSLQIRAKKVLEVKKDQEAGMQFDKPLDIRVGDVIKCIL